MSTPHLDRRLRIAVEVVSEGLCEVNLWLHYYVGNNLLIR